MKPENIMNISLTHFDGEGGAAAGGTVGASPTAPAAAPTTGATGNPAPAPDTVDPRLAEYAEFKTKYKDLYGNDVKTQIEDRLKKYKPIEQQHSALTKDVADLLELTGAKDLAEAKAKLQASRDKQIEDEAYEKGMDPEDYRKSVQNEKDAQAYRQIQQRETFVQTQMQNWQAQSAELAKAYPDFNLPTLSSNPDFVAKLQQGHSVKASFETVNAAKILSAVPEYEGFDFETWKPSDAFTALLEYGNDIKNAFEATNLDWVKTSTAKQMEKRTLDTIKGGGRVKEQGTGTAPGGTRDKGIASKTPQEHKRILDDILAGRAKASDYGM